MKITIDKNVIYAVLLVTFFLAAFYTVFSAPPGSQYTPGETLEPTCSPGDANCSVIPPAKSGVNDDITQIIGLTTPLSTNQGGTGTSTIFSPGTILFTENASGTFSGDNSNLFWDDSNNRLGIGTTTPSDPLTVDGRIGVAHLVGRGATPSISASAGAGAGPTVSIQGTDIAGRVTVTTGVAPAISSEVFDVTFAVAYDSPPYVLMTPADSDAASFSLLGEIIPNSSAISFSFDVGGTALNAATTYQWNYFVIQ